MLYIISPIVFILFLMPKIDLVDVGTYNAGIRIDDILIAGICLLLISATLTNGAKVKISKLEKYFLLFIATVIAGVTLNQILWGRGAILFPIRLIEYFVFFYIGRTYAVCGGNIHKIFTAIFIVNVAVVLLQLGGMIGGFTVRGYRADVSERVVGITSGPWELGVILNLVTCYFLANINSQQKKYAVLLISTLIILINGSRMSLVAQAVIVLIYFVSAESIVAFIKRIAVIVPVAILAVVFFGNSGVAIRSESLMSIENIQSLINHYNYIQVGGSMPAWKELGVLSGVDIDTSWSMRGTKWIYAVKLFLASPVSVLFGVGAGAFGNALDGGWLRIATECGMLGLATFLLFFMAIKRTNNTMSLMCIAFAINMAMIDIYMSYKVMSLLLFCAGYYRGKNYKKDHLRTNGGCKASPLENRIYANLA